LVLWYGIADGGPLRRAPLPAGEEATPDSLAPPNPGDPLPQRAEHLESLGATAWHTAGARGKGVKVAVLDTGFRGYRDQLGKALPAQVAVRSFRADGKMEARDSQHGIFCAEVIHALAPDAEMMLATWEPNSSSQFLEAVHWAKQQGARVISCSVIMPSWSDGEGGGPVHEALTRELAGKEGTTLMFASAGNTARRHWAGVFHADLAGWHEWKSGCTENRLRPWGTERVSVELCCPPGPKYQVVVDDLNTSEEVGHSASSNGRPSVAVVRFDPASAHRYRVRVRLLEGTPAPFHIVALGGDLDESTAHGSIPFPGDGPEVIAVGAVDAEGHRASYSSCGPNSRQPKPDLVAPVPFPTTWRDRPFSGTSAAAPQAAGLAALICSAHPDWSAARVRQTMTDGARDLGPPGHDWETGYGMIHLPAVAR
jgi:subtilisin family serine protease